MENKREREIKYKRERDKVTRRCEKDENKRLENIMINMSLKMKVKTCENEWSQREKEKI